MALLPAVAIAQQVQQANPADPGAPVPASSYVSAFKTYQASPEEQATPDTAWRSANEEVASQGTHAGHGGMAMPGMDHHSPKAASGTSQNDPHAAHGSHMAMPGMSNEATTTNSSASQPAPEASHSSHHH
ncbi:hypothetical protein [Noviherbaspirillum pedocola]|uniref:Uncharacterized protein n=1 Tax=Noviherbaspirillum pedocola TaxID=2801341 RepID=A0A934W578_9BURK|nr:hypothetical protein [Noviherbaspirillum pedocola]MBK4734652.1 hypothetical protein [Noviherbaspirillum pedocola]